MSDKPPSSPGAESGKGPSSPGSGSGKDSKSIIRQDSNPASPSKRPLSSAVARIRTTSGGSRGSADAFGRQDSLLSRQDSMRARYDAGTRRRRHSSLSLPHANSIPFHLDKPTVEDGINLDEDDVVDGTYLAGIDVVDLDVPWWTSKRLLLSFTCFIGFFCLYSLRVNLSTAIVCMVREEARLQQQLSNVSWYYNQSVYNDTMYGNSSIFNVSMPSTTAKPTLQCPSAALSQQESKSMGEFDWDKRLQGFILGAFFWGYTLMQMPSGYLSDRFGPRLMIACGMFPVSIITILCPFLARGSPYLLMVGRVAIGFGEAMMYPGMQSLWSKWSPPHERSRLVGFAFGGSQLGNALTFPFAGLLCAYGFDGGWPSVFYVIGLMGLVWCCVFVFFARDSPGEMASITPIEKKYIEQSLGVYGQTVEQRQAHRADKKPWAKIFTSGPVWAILLANACGNYGAYMLLTQMPTYMKEVLHFDIKSNGLYSMIPYLVFWMFVIIGGQIADLLISKKILSIEWTRKLCCCLGTVVPAIFLVLTGYMDCLNQMGAVVLLTLSMAFCGFQFSSFFINHGDIAPKYAGTVFGFTNMGASVPGIIAPYVVGAITPNQTREEWLRAFYIAGVVYIIGAILYVILAKGEVLDWAKELDEGETDGALGYQLHEIQENEEDEEEGNGKGKGTDEKSAMIDEKTNGVGPD